MLNITNDFVIIIIIVITTTIIINWIITSLFSSSSLPSPVSPSFSPLSPFPPSLVRQVEARERQPYRMDGSDDDDEDDDDDDDNHEDDDDADGYVHGCKDAGNINAARMHGRTSVSVVISLKSLVSRRVTHFATSEHIWQRFSASSWACGASQPAIDGQTFGHEGSLSPYHK